MVWIEQCQYVANVMSPPREKGGRELIERRKLSRDEVAGFLDRYPVDKVSTASSTPSCPSTRR